MAIRKVERYVTDDDEEFTSEKQAKAHDKRLKLKKW